MKHLTLLIVLASCAGAPTSSEDEIRAQAAAASSNYALYFSNPLPGIVERLRRSTSPTKPSEEIVNEWEKLGEQVIANGGQFASALAEMMKVAKGKDCKLLVAAYEFDIDEIANEMSAAKGRGCDVRLVTDGNTVADPKSAHSLSIVRDAGVPIHHDGSRGAIMHNKFVIAVGATESALWTGSWNFTHTDQDDYWNHGVVFRSPAAIPIYTEAFENLYERFDADGNRGPRVPLTLADGRSFTAGGAAFEVYFPANDKAGTRVVELLASAQKSIRVMAFSFTYDPFVDVVVERANAGIEVRGVFENTGACKGAYRTLYELGLDNVQMLRWKPGTTGFLHHKVFIIDEKSVVFGSYNFSDAGENTNDENALIVTDKTFAKPFVEAFDLIEEATAMREQEEGCSN